MKSLYTCLALSLTLAASAQTKRVNFVADKFYPEGVVFDKSANQFYVGSVKTGTIAAVKPDGSFMELYADSSLKSAYGMKIDPTTNLLWVCTGDPNYSNFSDSATYKKMIRLIAIDLNSRQKVRDIDMSSLYPGKHFLNDMAMDGKGNIYLTDSYSPVVYRVDKDGKASVFAQSQWFASVDLGLNGIIVKDNNLLVAHSDGQLYNIDITDPQRITKVKQKLFFPGADGLLWDAEGNLILVQNKGSHKIHKLKSTDGWKSVELVASTKATDRFIQPSTATMMGNDVYVLNSKLNELSDPMAIPSKEFSIQLAVFTPVK